MEKSQDKKKLEKLTKLQVKEFEDVVLKVLFSKKQTDIYENKKPTKEEKNTKFRLLKK